MVMAVGSYIILRPILPLTTIHQREWSLFPSPSHSPSLGGNNLNLVGSSDQIRCIPGVPSLVLCLPHAGNSISLWMIS